MDVTKLNKIIGYILLLAGLLLIVAPLYQTYTIFTGKATPPKIFKTQVIGTKNQANNPLNLEQQVQVAFEKILPIDLINNTLNLICWMILLFIVIFGGGQLANLGIRLVK